MLLEASLAGCREGSEVAGCDEIASFRSMRLQIMMRSRCLQGNVRLQVMVRSRCLEVNAITGSGEVSLLRGQWRLRIMVRFNCVNEKGDCCEGDGGCRLCCGLVVETAPEIASYGDVSLCE